MDVLLKLLEKVKVVSEDFGLSIDRGKTKVMKQASKLIKYGS